MMERTYGGKRGHEGCDIMASYNHRGVYPVVSVCDGTLEKIGWLPQGGWRLGIRSKSGVYYYYAHLSDYMKEYQIGEQIRAGEIIGFMGDTGYSEIEGTTGNFDVHLHFGIYLNDKNGKEYDINPYQVLQKLENKKRTLTFYEYYDPTGQIFSRYGHWNPFGGKKHHTKKADQRQWHSDKQTRNKG